MTLGRASICAKPARNRPCCAVNGAFNEMAEDAAAAISVSSGGNRLTTHTTDAAPRPASRGGSRRIGTERRMQSERK